MIRTDDALIFLRGLAMGAADIVPGVSGGTVALVLGVYRRLVTAISQFDGQLVGHLLAGRFSAAAKKVDLRFLAALGAGIGVGVVALAKLMHHLLEHHRSETSAAFFGLILGSSVLVARMAQPKSTRARLSCLGLGGLAAVSAFLLVGLSRVSPISALWYDFLCGAVAICAMILPGVSGAYLLLLLGRYEDITGIIKGLPHGEFSTGDLATLAVFAAGCAVGLALFSRVLRWLLERHWTPTMAVLGGFMVGSLAMVWPWQRDLTPDVEELKLKSFERYWPTSIDADAITYVLLAIGGVALVLGAQLLASKSGPAEKLPE